MQNDKFKRIMEVHMDNNIVKENNANQERDELRISFDINTINHLGVKLYTTIPPMVAELVSNAWDADARNVYIHLLDGEQKSISVSDDGVGMSFDELNNFFLMVGRNRRLELGKDETDSGRKVLGKKGLGKLSMFGIGRKITVTTIKDGIKNSFVMSYDEISNLGNGEYKPHIIDYQVPTGEKSGTTILIETLSRKSDFDLRGLHDSLLSRFRIFSEEFIVHINNLPELQICKNEIPEGKYQFVWNFPDDFEVDFDIEDEKNKALFEYGKAKGIKGKIYTAQTPLRKEMQGIILFSRGKLVQENKTFNARGNDNFFQYMSGNFDVDFIDADNAIDNCSTDRKSLAWDSFENEDLVTLNLLMEKLVMITQKKWRVQRKAEKKKKIENRGHSIDKWLQSLNPVEKPLAQRLTSAILENDDIADEVATEYIECIKDMYGFEGFKQFTIQLDELDELDNERAIKLLTDWTNIEAKEYAKIAIGRIKTIEQFEKFIRTNASERDVIQKFLEEFPWLLDPKMSKFEREVTYTRILKENFNDDYLPESNRRLDFLCTDESGVIHVIELKRPNIRITLKEIQQIAEYVKFLKGHYKSTITEIRGYLISDNMKFDDGVDIIIDGLRSQNIYVKSYSDLLAEARRYNKSLYDMYTKIDEAKGNLEK